MPKIQNTACATLLGRRPTPRRSTPKWRLTPRWRARRGAYGPGEARHLQALCRSLKHANGQWSQKKGEPQWSALPASLVCSLELYLGRVANAAVATVAASARGSSARGGSASVATSATSTAAAANCGRVAATAARGVATGGVAVAAVAARAAVADSGDVAAVPATHVFAVHPAVELIDPGRVVRAKLVRNRTLLQDLGT